MSELTFSEYQSKAKDTAVYPQWASVAYPLYGLCGELGELVEKVLNALNLPSHFTLVQQLREVARVCRECERQKKLIRDGAGFVQTGENEAITYAVETSEFGDPIIKELSDCIWYISALAGDLHENLGAVAEANLKKLADRKARGVIQGSGDQR